MGHGLSPLQKLILQIGMDGLAHYKKLCKKEMAKPKKDRNEDLITFGDRISIAQIFVSAYGWSPKANGGFSKKEIGEKQYLSAKVSVHKALKRLKRRGLIDFRSRDFSFDKSNYPHGYFYLTVEGEEVAAALSSQSKSA